MRISRTVHRVAHGFVRLNRYAVSNVIVRVFTVYVIQCI